MSNYKESIYFDEDVYDPSDLEELVYDSIVPAVCTEGCEVEPDGYCQHGMPSLLIHIGII